MRTYAIHKQKPIYHRESVQKCIDSSKQKISKRQSQLIHSLLAGWQEKQTQQFKNANTQQ